MKAMTTLGLPGSGKSTWAKQYVLDHPDTIRINNDEIRNAIYERLGHRNWSKEIENKVKAERSAMILGCFLCGKNIIIDNTHCNKWAFEAIQKECGEIGYDVEIVDFTGVSADECIRRDALREGHERVGEEVIRRMEKQLAEITNPKPKKVLL